MRRSFRCTVTSLGFILVATLLVLAASGDEHVQVHVVQIRNAIGDGLREYISRSIRLAQQENSDLLLFDIHTPGGAVNSTSDIIKLIEESGLPTIAFVNDEAISAGALITLSCDVIAMAPGGTIGDAQPIPTNSKTVSYVMGKIRAIAEKQGRNPDVAAAMVDKDLVLVRLADGRLKALSSPEYHKRLNDGEEMEVISPEGNVLVLSSDSAFDLGIADLKAKNIAELLSEVVLVRDAGGRTFVTTRSKSDGISLRNADVRKVPLTIAEKIAIFVTNPMIASLLLSLGVLGLIFEFKTVGWGVAGSIGLLCLVLFFGGHMIARIDAGIGLFIFLIGVGLLLLEIFVIPGFGIAGISGIALSIIGLLFTLDTNTGTWSSATMTLAQSVIMMVVIGGALAYILPKTAIWKSTILSVEETTDKGYAASGIDPAEFEGKVGTTITPLRPAGIALVNGKRVDVVSEGEYIDKDTKVEVVRVEGRRIVVRPVTEG